MKPILFNAEMVQAILEGRKSTTRRAIKTKRENTHIEVWGGAPVEVKNGEFLMGRGKTPPYNKDDILYVRETWNISNIINPDKYLYQADYIEELSEHIYPYCNWKWKPSIHMPKDAARIFLRVTNVSVAKLQDITEEQAIDEGAEAVERYFNARDDFKTIWDSTIKGENNYVQYGWFANPWVWVIEFERIAKEDAI
jgi:uncharacterized protein YhfF